MAVLSNADRVDVTAEWQRENNITVTITKNDLRAAVNAIDDWVDTNAAAFNSALPLAARNNLTARQKAWLLFFVVRRRFEIS